MKTFSKLLAGNFTFENFDRVQKGQVSSLTQMAADHGFMVDNWVGYHAEKILFVEHIAGPWRRTLCCQ
jgi:hypothetical protein|tara:strand:+ start:2829 stop:3032 length:204 start_codon:yes stop_codon:yes gene_type:complete